MSNKTEILMDLLRLVCKQTTNWNHAIKACHGRDGSSAKAEFLKKYYDLEEPLTEELVKVLASNKFMVKDEALMTIRTLALIEKSDEHQAKSIETWGYLGITEDGLKSMIWFLCSTLSSWKDHFDKSLLIESELEFKKAILMRTPTIQGSQMNWDVKAIGSQEFAIEKCIQATQLLSNQQT